MTDPTPTRDEAVPAGWKLVPVEPTEEMIEAMCDAYRQTRRSGVSGMTLDAQFRAEFAQWFAAYSAMLASAPAPASGGVDAVAELLRASKALLNNLWVGNYTGSRTFEENWKEFDRKFPGVKWLHEAHKAASLSPAATPVSEAGGELHHVTGERITRKDLNNAHRMGREEGRLAAELLPALAQPASPPAGGDVREASLSRSDVCRLWQYAAIERPSMTVEGFTNLLLNEIDDRAEALSQSTSAGREDGP